MKLLFDFLPIVLFFTAYKFGDIYLATTVTMVATALQLLVSKFIFKKVDGMLWFTAATVIGLGSLTLLVHNPMFIKWKPTLVYAGMAAALFISQRFFQRNLIRSALVAQLPLPEALWPKLNWAWVVFLSIMAIVNIVIAYSFSEAAWVNFKFISFFITLLFCVAMIASVAKHLPKEKEGGNAS